MLKRICTLFGLLVIAAIPSFADITLLTFTGGDYSPHFFNQTVGWEFHVNQTFNVAALHWFDPTGSDPTAHQVAIWNNLGSLVVETCVGSGCAGSSYVSHPQNPNYWQTPVTATLLAGNDYVIGGFVGPSDPLVANATAVTTDPLITFRQNRYGDHGVTSLLRPDNNYSPQEFGYFGPNLSATPEPGFYGALALGMSGLIVVVQRRRRAKSL
jgi:hypothetical protein